MNIKTGDIIKFVNKNKRSLNKDFTVHIQHDHKGCKPSVVTKFTEASSEDLTPMSNTVVEKATQYTKFLKGFDPETVVLNKCSTCGKIFYADSLDIGENCELIISGKETKED